jgi:hypothetical protein
MSRFNTKYGNVDILQVCRPSSYTFYDSIYKKGEATALIAVDVRQLVRRRGSHVFYIILSQMAARLPAGRPFLLYQLMVPISVTGRVDPGSSDDSPMM